MVIRLRPDLPVTSSVGAYPPWLTGKTNPNYIFLKWCVLLSRTHALRLGADIHLTPVWTVLRRLTTIKISLLRRGEANA